MELQQEIAFDKAADMIGREIYVMIEGKVADEDTYAGRTISRNWLPDYIFLQFCHPKGLSGWQ